MSAAISPSGVFVGGHLLGLLTAVHDLDRIRVLVPVVSRAEFVEDRDADLVTVDLVGRFMDAQSASARLLSMTFAREAHDAFNAHFPVWIID